MGNEKRLTVRVSDGLAKCFAASEALSDAELLILTDKARQNAAHYRENINPQGRSNHNDHSSSGLS